jgi:hypothetical protein
VAVVSEESESVDADAEGSPDIDDRELRWRRPPERDGFIVWFDVVDREEIDPVEGVGETGRVEVEGGELYLGCGVFRAARVCACNAFSVDVNFWETIEQLTIET